MHRIYIIILWLSIACNLSAQQVVSVSYSEDTARSDSDMNDNAAVDTLVSDTLQIDSLSQIALPWPENVVARMDKLLDVDLFKTSQVALAVYDLTADSLLFCHNERQIMRPASTQKLLTAITALDRLGDSYQFKTQLYHTGQLCCDSVLRGDLICVGGMDPRFNGDDMRAFAESVSRTGARYVIGMIKEDTSFKDKDRLGEGWCWDDDNPVLTPLLVSKKDRFVEQLLKDLSAYGIKVVMPSDTAAISALGLDSIARLRVPNTKRHLCTRTHNIDQILLPMLGDSNNLYAESVFYQIAASTGSRPATAKHAAEIEKQLIRKLGLTPSNYRIADGSGLSLYNYQSAELQVALLRYAYNNPNIYGHLIPALPSAGKSGTLKKRMTGAITRDNVHAKTGTLTGCITLAGYLTAANGHVLCFSILNNGIMSTNKARTFQDRVCTALCMP